MVAAIGVLSHASRGAMRSAIRQTWLSPWRVPAGVAAQFVLRHSSDAPAPPALLDEVRAHDDMLFVDAPANLSRANGPLLSLVLWLCCARRASVLS